MNERPHLAFLMHQFLNNSEGLQYIQEQMVDKATKEINNIRHVKIKQEVN